MFIGRNNELNFLNSQYSELVSSLVVIYGRRRIGKTALIKQFIKNKNSLYFLATEESDNENKKSFLTLISEKLKDPLVNKFQNLSWHELFKLVFSKGDNEKLIIVLDEFQYLTKAEKAFPSILQKIWDEYLSKNGCMVILCGSLISMMVSQTLSYKSPLYGRRTGQLKLKQIPFNQYDLFFSNKVNLIEFYSITSGVPKYIEILQNEKNVKDAIEKHILSTSGFLYEEPVFLLERELGEIGTYFSIIKTIAAGNHKIGHIASRLQTKQSNMTKYLKTLIDMDILERRVPITEKNPEKSKKGLYFIKDNFIKFWFRYIYPNRAMIELEEKEYVLSKILSTFVENHTSFVYEDICLSHLADLNKRDELPFKLEKIGKWWAKDSEIDIVAFNESENSIVFSECKYTKKKVGTDLFIKLVDKSNHVNFNNDAKRYFILFSHSGFEKSILALADERQDLILIKL